MKRILSLLLALILVAGVCLCISSCEEAEDTSSTETESDTSSSVPTGRDIIAKSSAKDAWNDYIYGSSAKTVLVQFGADRLDVAATGYIEDHFIRSNDEIDEVKNILKELESHIVKQITQKDVNKLDDQRRTEFPDDYYYNLADITMFDGTPKIVYTFGLEPVCDGISILINKDYLIVSGAAFEYDGDVSEITEKIKSIRDREITENSENADR